MRIRFSCCPCGAVLSGSIRSRPYPQRTENRLVSRNALQRRSILDLHAVRSLVRALKVGVQGRQCLVDRAGMGRCNCGKSRLGFCNAGWLGPALRIAGRGRIGREEFLRHSSNCLDGVQSVAVQELAGSSQRRRSAPGILVCSRCYGRIDSELMSVLETQLEAILRVRNSQ